MANKNFQGVFLKLGQREHLLQLQQGLLYCNTLAYFAGINDDYLRGDELENVVELKYIEDEVMSIKKPEEPDTAYKDFTVKGMHIKTRRTDPFCSLFCLYKINILEEAADIPIRLDAKNQGFGDHFLIITDTSEFLSRLKAALNKKNIHYACDHVEYIDFSKYSGTKTVFQKHILYSYQKEWRLQMENKTEEPILLEIGDLTDISMLDVASIEKLQFKYSEARPEDVKKFKEGRELKFSTGKKK